MKMMILATGLFCVGVGAATLWTNPRRLANQVFALLAFLAGAWLACIFGAIHAGDQFEIDGVTSPLPWVRANGFVSVLLFWSIWLLNEAIVSAATPRRVLRRAAWTLLALTPLLVLTLSDWYASASTTPGSGRHGPGYYIYTGFAALWQTRLLVHSVRQIRTYSGMRRVEALFLSFNLSLASLLTLAMTTMGNWLHVIWLRRSGSAVFFVAFLVAAWAISFHRVFNARQILWSLGQRIGLLLAAAIGVVVTREFLAAFVPSPVDYLLSFALCCALAFWIDRKCRAWLQLGNEHALAELRRGVIVLARTEPHAERLVAAFEQLLRQQAHAKTATLIFDWDEICDRRLELVPDSAAHAVLCETGWATPESLERRRSDPGVDELRQFFAEHSLGLVVATPRGSPSPTLLVALGTKTSGWPFTSPNIQCMQEVAELMDNILTRSRLTSQAALHAKMEHLGMMSRGLAHDLKNLITPISSYLVHTEGRFEPGGAEEEVHRAAQRSVRVMTEYVREAAFFANQLTPQFEKMQLGRILAVAHELTAKRAALRGITITLQAEALVFVADAVLLQRLIVNLLHNAIDASGAGDAIFVRGSAGEPDAVRIEVADEGCGIPADKIGRIFDPYFTTKEFGDDVRGFGLGLTICQKIAHLHGGTLTVQSTVEVGTTFTLKLPAKQRAEHSHDRARSAPRIAATASP